MIAVYDIEVQADAYQDAHDYDCAMWAKVRASQAGEVVLSPDEEREMAVFLCGIFRRDD